MLCSVFLLFTLSSCGLLATPTPAPATVYVNFDLGTGGSGFAATLYAQEVTSGKTFKGFYAAGSHGLVVLATSAPAAIVVDETPEGLEHSRRPCGYAAGGHPHRDLHHEPILASPFRGAGSP